MNARAWVKKAVLNKGKKKKNTTRAARLENKGILSVYVGDGIMVGTDNHRIHFWADESIQAEPIGEIEYPLKRIMDYLEKGRAGIELCEFSTYALRKACTVALAFFKKQNSSDYILDGSKFIYVDVDEHRIRMRTKREEVGSMEFTLENGDTFPLKTKTHDLFYEFKADTPDDFYVNPTYFKQALDGMGKSATLRKAGDLLHLTGESGAEAIIMPLQSASFEKILKIEGVK